MKRESEENNHKTSQLKRSRRHEITAGERSGVIHIPLDLMVEILKKLPVKSLMRFRCISKQWSSIISSRRDFIDSIVTRSLAQPQPTHFIFHHWVKKEPFFFFSSTYPQKPEKQKLIITPKVLIPTEAVKYDYIRGLICCSMLKLHLVTICNPTTRQSFDLPEIKSPTSPFEMTHSFFGYEPVMNQFKVLCFFNGLRNLEEQSCRIFTLGDSKRQYWRNIKGIENRYPSIKEVYIDGTVYYGASILKSFISPVHGMRTIDRTDTTLLSFDVRSEKFNHVKTPKPLSEMLLNNIRYNPTMVNYQGKLGCICNNNGGEIWVMENADDDKQEWSKTIFCLPNPPLNRFWGVTSGGEIFGFDYSYVYYYDPKKNSFRRVKIEGSEQGEIWYNHSISIIPVHDHVENTMWL